MKPSNPRQILLGLLVGLVLTLALHAGAFLVVARLLPDSPWQMPAVLLALYLLGYLAQRGIGQLTDTEDTDMPWSVWIRPWRWSWMKETLNRLL
ncbi:hypothetical protein [Saccharothrix texasensis]|uniref:hypothetical protein n=1 Tax=Saccharothrix texasensis TaxID=103734 RepID=UPI000F4B114A|nr:hypothetical protein [Saccharothrix texasensis]